MPLTKVSYAMINGDFANVLDFGADSTGVADSTVAINAALAASYSVYIPAGTYNIQGVISITRSGTTLVGSGRGNTVLVGADNYSSDPSPNPVINVESPDWVSSETRLSDITIADMTITGKIGSVLSNRDGVGFFGIGTEGIFNNLNINGFKRRAVYAKDLWDSTFFECVFYNNSFSNVNNHAVLLDADVGNSNAVRFIGCHWEGNATGDVWLRTSANQISFIGNKFEGSNADPAYADENIVLIESSCSNIVFNGNTCTMNQKNPAVHWMSSGATGLQIVGNTFQCANDLLGAAALSLTTQSNLIGTKVIGNMFYLDGSQSVYPIELGSWNVFEGNTLNVVNPRKVISAGQGSIVENNTVIGKGTVNQAGDIFVYFSTSGAFIKDNSIYNTVNTVSNALISNINEPSPANAVISVANNFDPNQYRSNTIFSATAPITLIQGAYTGKEISLVCGGANTLTASIPNGIILNGMANFAPANYGVINLVYIYNVGWVEKSRMTYF